MGRKSSGKLSGASGPPPGARRSLGGATIAVGAVVVVLGGFLYWRQSPAGAPHAAETPPSAAVVAKPHVQETLPPLQFPTYALQRPHDVIRAAYRFAAEHPEVLTYVPCFCGCEAGGHRGNHDCFVRERAANGDVVAWDEHGMDCNLCIDIAWRSRQLLEEGKSVADIRVAIEREWGGRSLNKTPTPPVPRTE